MLAPPPFAAVGGGTTTRLPLFEGKGFANKITPTQVQMFCGWVGAFLFIEGEIICFVVFT